MFIEQGCRIYDDEGDDVMIEFCLGPELPCSLRKINK